MIRFASTCVLALTLAACASSPSQPAAPSKTVARVSLGNVDAAAAAALRIAAVDRDPARALNAMRQASAAAPDRADLARLSLQFCLNAPGCQPEPYETRLRKLDPANGVVWLGPLGRAQAKRDAQAEQQILQAMGQAERLDLYWNTLLWRLASALPPAIPAPNAPNLPVTTALNDVTLWLAAAGVPSFETVGLSCSETRVAADPNVRSRCARVGQVLQRGDTALVEGIGLGITQRVSDPGSPVWNETQQRINALAHQTEASGRVIRSQVERERFSVEMMELLKKLPREQDVQVAVLRWAGQPVGAAR